MDQQQREVVPGGRFDSLDGIRTLAVLAVMFYHVVPSAIRGGSIGVDVFFTLSGFVITTLLLAEHQSTGRIRLTNFYILRVSRLWPALFAVCAFVAGLAFLLPASFWAGEQDNAIRSALHVMNFHRGGWFVDQTDGGSLGHTWSLAVEEHFYVVWPVLLILMLRFIRSLRFVAIVTTVICVIVVAERLALQLLGAGYERIYNGPDTRADQLLIGCVLAMVLALSSTSGASIVRTSRLSRLALWPCAAFIATALLSLAYPHGGDSSFVAYRTLFPFVIALAAAGLIWGLVLNADHSLSRALSNRWLSWPGRYLSYGMYLWHYPIFFLLRGLNDGPGSSLIRLPVGVIVTIVVAYLSTRFLEEPIRRAVRRRVAAKGPSLVADPGVAPS